jgi:hypothetical protein
MEGLDFRRLEGRPLTVYSTFSVSLTPTLRAVARSCSRESCARAIGTREMDTGARKPKRRIVVGPFLDPFPGRTFADSVPASPRSRVSAGVTLTSCARRPTSTSTSAPVSSTRTSLSALSVSKIVVFVVEEANVSRGTLVVYTCVLCVCATDAVPLA